MLSIFVFHAFNFEFPQRPAPEFAKIQSEWRPEVSETRHGPWLQVGCAAQKAAPLSESSSLTVLRTVLAECGLEELCWSGESGEAVTPEEGVDDGER